MTKNRVLLLTVVLIAWGAVEGAPPAAQSKPVTSGDVQLGKQVYEKECVECHGAEGHGDGRTAKRLGFMPRDFTRGAFKCRCTPTGEPPSDEDLFRSISTGLPGTPMVRHDKTLTEGERWALVQYVKTLSQVFPADNPSCAPLPPAPESSAERVAEGRVVYRLLQCSKCHGATGKGDGPAAASLKDTWGQPIKPHNFAALGTFKCGNRDLDLYRTLRTGLTGTPMPSFDLVLQFARDDFSPENLKLLGSATEVAEITQYLEQQPDARSMSDETRQTLSSRRTWALVQFIRSLVTW